MPRNSAAGFSTIRSTLTKRVARLISNAEFELAQAVRDQLDHARDLLLVPTLKNLLSLTPALERSAGKLAQLEGQVRATGREDLDARQQLRREIHGLRQSLRGIEGLMTNAAAFYSGWAGLIGIGAASYTRTGEPGRVPEVRTMNVTG